MFGFFLHILRHSFPSVMLLRPAVTFLFIVNYTNAHLTDCARGYRDIWALLTWWKPRESVFSHSQLSQTAKRKKKIISWNCWFTRCFCLVCKRLQLCMCSAGSVSFPLFTLDKVRQLNEGERPQSEKPVVVSLGFSLLLVSVFDSGW